MSRFLKGLIDDEEDDDDENIIISGLNANGEKNEDISDILATSTSASAVMAVRKCCLSRKNDSRLTLYCFSFFSRWVPIQPKPRRLNLHKLNFAPNVGEEDIVVEYFHWLAGQFSILFERKKPDPTLDQLRPLASQFWVITAMEFLRII